MVKRYPATKEDLSSKNKNLSLAEIRFFEICEDLSEGWSVWYSINWDKRSSIKSGEADYVLFHKNYGYVVIEVKGGIIEVENDVFYSISTKKRKKYKLDRSPFEQAKGSMYSILNFYTIKTKKEPHPMKLLRDNKYFPLSFAYGVFFPDCYFKNNFESIQYPFRRIFDKKDYQIQLQWQKNRTSKISPLEQCLIDLLDEYKRLREIKPGTEDFFHKIMGSNIKHYVNLRHDLNFRESELEKVNQVQDYLLRALKYKNHCIFKGSAGSGKTFIAMKKALMTYREGKRVLFLCFNTELREFIRSYIGEQLNVTYHAIEDRISVYSINLLLSEITSEIIKDENRKREVLKNLSKFNYTPIMGILEPSTKHIPNNYKYDALIVDEAQDIEKEVWELFPNLLHYPKDSIYYVFYDEAQAIFLEDFSPKDFAMDPTRDLISLTQNLRNTQEIARFLEDQTSYEDFTVLYEEYSGIAGLDITRKQFNSVAKAITKITTHIKKEYYNNGIGPEHIIVLGLNRLTTLLGKKNVADESSYEYISLKDRNEVTPQRIYIIEPDNINEIPEIRMDPENDKLIIYKTISSFKGLERDVVYLLLPNIKEYKEKFEWRYKGFIKRVYVGASRAKFKLYIYEYSS